MIIEQPSYSRLDVAFADFLCQRAALPTSQKPAFATLVMAVSSQQNQGHNCIAIEADCKPLLLASGLVMDNPDDLDVPPLPLVLEANRLYLHRYWFYEQRLAQQLTIMIKRDFDDARLEDLLDNYFGKPEQITNWQREAAKVAVKQAFCIITGGPGTGKTTTVVKILAVLQTLAEQPLHIALAAPTGKAAMRLQEAIGINKAALPADAAIKASIPETVSTLHRLLGAKPQSPYFRHDSQQPLPYDLVVVDEASMVDLALISKLVDALKPNARLILLGDKDQLASVESGAVLADLTSALAKQTVELQVSYRFGGAIKALAVAINDGQAEHAWQILQDGHAACELLFDDLIAYSAEQQWSYLAEIKAGAAVDAIFRAFNRFQVLCANRQGGRSVADINYRVEQALQAQHRIQLSGAWYVGRPVMVLQNNPALQLYNGDIGLCLKDELGKLMVFFQRPDGSIKKYLPARLPQCETVFAMTIHKSQGSEFEEVLLVLPEQLNPVLTKELLYTGITRAKKVVRLLTEEAVFLQAVKQKVSRVTGLVEKFQA